MKAGVITDAQLRDALKEQKQWGGRLGDILVRMQVLSEDVFVRALSKQLGLPRADMSAEIPLEALARVPAEVAEEYEIVPIAVLEDGRALAVATSDPLNATAMDAVRGASGLRPVPHVAGASWVRAAISRLYQANSHVNAGTPAPPPVARPAPPVNGTMVQNAGTIPTAPLTPALGLTAPPAAPSGSQPSSDPRVAALEESYRREVQALKALVEILVQRGVIDLDEYLSKLRR